MSITTKDADVPLPDEPILELEAGSTIAYLEVVLPAADQFLLRGTLPVPPGIWPSIDGQIPATVKDYTGTGVTTQVETVSRYPSPADGADVVEILARVHRDPALAPGTRTQYAVTFAPHAAPADPGTHGMEDLLTGPTSIPASVSGLLGNPANLRVVASDVFGHEYQASPLAGNDAVLYRHGDVMTQLRTYDTMLPVTPVAGGTGTLPHLFGVHAYLSVVEGYEVVLLDLRFNNGADGHDQGTDVDDPLKKFYFEELELEVPSGWVVLQDGVDPYFGTPYSSGGMHVQPLVKPIGDGTLHVMPQQGQFHRRLALAPAGSQGVAQALLDQDGLAFSVPAIDPDSELPLLSWWNGGVGRYFPQAHTLPRLDHVGLASLRVELAGEFADLRGHLENGTDTGGYPLAAGNLGWAHPYGVGYGGMTGGNEINLYQGVRTAAAASVEGYRQLIDLHRMHTERMPVTLYSIDGTPSSIPDWVTHEADYSWIPFFYFNGKQNGGSDAFGYDAAPTFQVDHVVANGLGPAYEDELDDFQSHDTQHLVRYTRSPKALAWLGNDALAKDDLQMQAENFHLEYSPHYNSWYQHVQPTGLLSDMLEVDANPGKGFGFGRGEGWGLDAVNAAYALSRDEDWRDYTRGWLELVVETVNTGQADCSGIIQAQETTKWLGGLYRIRQSIEQAIIENALRGMRERVFEDVSPAHEAMLDDILHDSYYGMVSGLAWADGEPGPWSHLAVAPTGASSTPYCLAGDLPPDGQDGYVDTYQIWSSLAYAYELTSNPLFLNKVLFMNPGGSLLPDLEGAGTSNIGNKAALLALAQKLEG